MIRYRARWVLPISRLPLENATVVEHEGRIVYVGDPAGAPAGTDMNLGDVALLPGLVNAHTHLELSSLHGKIAGGRGFVAWVDALVGTRAAGNLDDQRAIRAPMKPGLDLDVNAHGSFGQRVT